MVALTNIPAGEHVPTAGHRVVLAGVSWEHYEVELIMRGEKSSPRIAYLEGAMELTSPSSEHERISSYLGRLIEGYAELHDIELSPYRSWTLKSGRSAGGEPDECYVVGADQVDRRRAARDLHEPIEFAGVRRDQAARGKSRRTPGSAARSVLPVRDEREPAVRRELPALRRPSPTTW